MKTAIKPTWKKKQEAALKNWFIQTWNHLDKLVLNTDEVMREVGRGLGLPSQAMKSPSQVKADRALKDRLGQRKWAIRQAKKANRPQDFFENCILLRAYPSGFVRRPYAEEDDPDRWKPRHKRKSLIGRRLK